MNVISIARRASSSLIFAMLVLISSGTYAFNRIDVFSELDNLNTNWDQISIDMWINDFESDADPGVMIGDKIIYKGKTSKPAFFVLILIDAKGSTAILQVDAIANGGIVGASKSLIFPTIDENNSEQIEIQQAEPLGKETIYLLVSDQRLPASVFGFDALSNYADYGADIKKVKDLVARLNGYTDSIKIALHKYEYYVDSDTQFSTRGIKRVITQRVQEVEEATGKPLVTAAIRNQAITKIKPPAQSSKTVMNDIKFEYGSDVLTSEGIRQLEILGSELIDRQADNQLPDVLLIGHTDSTGSAKFNMILSERRSKAAKRFLVEELGLPGEYIDTVGMGDSVPMHSNTTGIGRAGNRRVEFMVMQ
jgi:outer membrane protein OmpA-like peptidoglycan-associated protein